MDLDPTMMISLSQKESVLMLIDCETFETCLEIDLNAQIERYTDNNNQTAFTLKNSLAIQQVEADLICIACPS
jgi:hypothetical protein